MKSFDCQIPFADQVARKMGRLRFRRGRTGVNHLISPAQPLLRRPILDLWWAPKPKPPKIKMTAKPRNAGAMGRTLDRLREMIARGELSPGEQIRQEEMSELFQVSRVPLREAMNVLADQGLLFHRPHQGYFVTKRAPGERAQIRRMLHLLENELMQTIQWPDDAVIAALQGLNEQMRRQSELRDVGRMVELNRQFHFQIFTLSPNHLILEEVRRLWALTETMMWNKYEREEDRKKTLREHQLLIDALASRDLARCAAEMENHRYSMESGLPIELPGAAPDMPVPEAH